MNCAACKCSCEGRRFNGKYYCDECYNELAHGIIGPPPKPTVKPGRYGPLEDISPWQENAIRDMEG